MALIDFHDYSSSSDPLLPSAFTAGIFSEVNAGSASTDQEGRWKYRASVLFVGVASLALWAGIFEVYRALV